MREQAERGRSPAETVAKAVEIGARVVDNEGTAANVDYVRRELQSGLGELNKELSSTLVLGSEGLAERIAAAFGSDRSDSVQQQIKEIVTASTERQRLELTKLLSAEDKSNPLVAIQARMGRAIVESDERHRQEMGRLREAHANESRATQRHVAELREQIARLLERQEGEELLAEAEAAGTRKGRTFEERVHAAIERIAEARGDCAHHVGDEPGDGGSKKGDTVVEIGAAEGKPLGPHRLRGQGQAALSSNRAWEELNAAMAERHADFAVLVVAGEENIPAKREQLVEYEGNKVIVAVDPELPDELGLELAYRYARLRVLATRDRALEVDAGGVRDAAEAARSALKRAQSDPIGVDQHRQELGQGPRGNRGDRCRRRKRARPDREPRGHRSGLAVTHRRRRLGKEQLAVRVRSLAADGEAARLGARVALDARPIAALREGDLERARLAGLDLARDRVLRAAQRQANRRLREVGHREGDVARVEVARRDRHPVGVDLRRDDDRGGWARARDGLL